MQVLKRKQIITRRIDLTNVIRERCIRSPIPGSSLRRTKNITNPFCTSIIWIEFITASGSVCVRNVHYDRSGGLVNSLAKRSGCRIVVHNLYIVLRNSKDFRDRKNVREKNENK